MEILRVLFIKCATLMKRLASPRCEMVGEDTVGYISALVYHYNAVFWKYFDWRSLVVHIYRISLNKRAGCGGRKRTLTLFGS